MNTGNPYFIHKGCQQVGSQLENVYVVYTPKIIKFVYNGSPSSISHQLQQQQILEMTRLISNKVENKPISMESSNARNGCPVKTPKIKLVSRKTTQIYSQKNNKSVFDSSYSHQDQQKKLRSTRKLKTYSALQNTAHKAKKIEQRYNPGIQTISWNLFESCNQPIQQKQFQYRRQDVSKISSRIICLDAKQPEKKVDHQERSTKVEKLNNIFRERKRIFDRTYDSRLTKFNKSFDGYKQSRSRSRKSIFEPYETKSRSFSQELSFFKRRRIFESKDHGIKLVNSSILKEERFDEIKEDQIPESILSKWKSKERHSSQIKELTSQQDSVTLQNI